MRPSLPCHTLHVAQQRLYLTDEQRISFLVDPIKALALECFLGRECTVSEAVAFKEHRWSRPRMAYWVKKLLEVGLIEQVGWRSETQRVAVYRTIADEFVVTGAVAQALLTQSEGFLKVQQKMLGWLQTSVIMHYKRLGDDFVMLHYRRDERGVNSEFMSRWELEGQPARGDWQIQDQWMRVRIPRAQAVAFASELEALAERILDASMDASDDSQPFYIGHLALVEDLD